MILASLGGASGVMLGAFGAHALKDRLAEADLAIFETAVRYQMYHVLALFLTASVISKLEPSSLPSYAGWLFVAGILIFSGSLYVLVLSGQRWLGAITPIGGICLIAAWFCLALAAFKA